MGTAANAILLTAVCVGAVGLGVAGTAALGFSLAPVPVGVALGICLFPALATLVFADLVTRRAPDYGPAAVMVGTAMRMGAAVVGVMLFGEQMERFGTPRERFALWVVGLYLVTLVGECGLLIRTAKRIGAGAAR